MSSERVSWQTTMVFFALCSLILGSIWGPLKVKFDYYHLFSLLAGVAGAFGFLFFFQALSRGSASRVIPLTSLYVAISSGLAFIFLSEPLSLKKILGLFCAILAMFLISG
jgi:uncharacterized membrane protein